MVPSRVSSFLPGAAAFAVLTMLPGAALALVECGAILTTDTTLSASDPVVGGVCKGNGLVLEDGVTLDCAGHTVRGGGKGAGISVAGKGEGVFIVNCAVEGFSTGVLLNGGGFHGVERTVVTGAKREGVDIASDDNFVSTTVVLKSQTGFKVSGVFNEVSDSVAIDNSKVGYSLTGREHFIFNNLAAQNGAGFTGSVTLTDLSSNTAVGNKGPGFEISGGKGDKASFISDNRALANTGNGLVATGSDDGGNLGLANGGPIACQINGIACSE